mgnify:FL=1
MTEAGELTEADQAAARRALLRAFDQASPAEQRALMVLLSAYLTPAPPEAPG